MLACYELSKQHSPVQKQDAHRLTKIWRTNSYMHQWPVLGWASRKKRNMGQGDEEPDQGVAGCKR